LLGTNQHIPRHLGAILKLAIDNTIITQDELSIEECQRKVDIVIAQYQSEEEAKKNACEYVLPPLDTKKYTYTLVLDLDETLVHFEAAERKFRLRPGCVQFLRAVSQP
jgi:predicted secreted acid phosphatase